MTILIYEDNLLWSARLDKYVRSLGHTPVVVTRPDVQAGDVAIVNLGAPHFGPETLVPALRAQGTRVIGHAGHKELELHELGKSIGCDVLATNRELTFQLDRILRDLP